ncbi:MAG: OmpP1/FadL family transporter [Mangrovibacterium sp.]
MKRIYFLAVCLITAGGVKAQYMADAYRMSNHQVQGTARSIAMGNAIGAVGGDFTSLSVNPAGIGLYRTNEFSFSTSFKFSKSDLSLTNANFEEKDFKLHFNQLGFVGTSKSTNLNSPVVSFNYGIGYNKLADFNQSFFGSVNQSSVSFLDDIADYANFEGLPNAYLQQNFNQIDNYSDWPAKLAWDTYLINPKEDENGQIIDKEYVSILYNDEKVDQLISGERSGRINEYVFSGGLNINHRFYLGATLGVHDILYKQETNYTEFMTDDSFTYTDYRKLSGTGINFKLGAIVKPVQSIRLGLAWHSPTYYDMNEESVLAMRSYLLESYYSEGINLFDYDFRTPMKVVGSGAFLIEKIAMISFDVEYMDYQAMRFKNGGGYDPMTLDNNQIKQTFGDAWNYRVGAEFRVAKSFSLLAGYENYGNPVKTTNTYGEELPSDNTSSIAFGLGYSFNNFYFDTALKHYESKATAYNLQPNFYETPLKEQNNTVTFTLGLRF